MRKKEFIGLLSHQIRWVPLLHSPQLKWWLTHSYVLVRESALKFRPGLIAVGLASSITICKWKMPPLNYLEISSFPPSINFFPTLFFNHSTRPLAFSYMTTSLDRLSSRPFTMHSKVAIFLRQRCILCIFPLKSVKLWCAQHLNNLTGCTLH